MLKKVLSVLLTTTLFSTVAFASNPDISDLFHKAKQLKETVSQTVDHTKNDNRGSEVEGMQETDLVSKYPGSMLMAQQTNDLTRVVLPLSANLRSDDKNYKKLKLKGEQSVYIYDVPDDVSKSYLKVFTKLKQNLASAGFEGLWECDSADKNCGYFFPRQFVFEDRGEDASKIYNKFSGLTNFYEGDVDHAIYTGRLVKKSQTYFMLLIVGSYSGKVQYSFEIVKSDDPLPATNNQSSVGDSHIGSAPSQAPAVNPVAGYEVTIFPGSVLYSEGANDLTRVVFPLSANNRQDDKNYKKLKLTGEQKIQIFNVPTTVSNSYLKVSTKLKQNLLSAGYEILWQCDSANKDCGYFFPRQFIFEERGKDASQQYNKLSGLTNFTSESVDHAIMSARIKVKSETYFALIIVGSYNSSVQYSIEIVKAEDPLALSIH